MPVRFLLLSLVFVHFAAQAELPPAAMENVRLRGNFDNSRLRFEKEKAGHVVFLGGSITQNAKGHTAMLPAWLEARFPDTEFTFTNAGLSSTCSTTGAFRLKEHVLSKGPVDLFIVEFAVNDDQDAGHAKREALRGMEGIVRHVRKYNSAADIVMVHFANQPIIEKFKNGEVPVSVDAHESVAQHYEITSVNVGATLAAGAMAWKEYGGVHPGQVGYRMVSDMIISALDQAWAQPLPDDFKIQKGHDSPDPLDAEHYGGGEFFDANSTDWMGGWKTTPVSKEVLPRGGIREDYKDLPLTIANESGAQMTVHFAGTAIGAFVLAGPDAGILEASVDGAPFKAIDLYHDYSKGLNYPRTVMFATDLANSFHQMTLRVAERPAKKDGPQGNQAAILQLVVNKP